MFSELFFKEVTSGVDPVALAKQAPSGKLAFDDSSIHDLMLWAPFHVPDLTHTHGTLMTFRGIFWGLGAWGTWDWTGRSALQRLPFGASSRECVSFYLVCFSKVRNGYRMFSFWHARLNLYLLNVRTLWSSHGSVNDSDVRWYCPKYFWLQNCLLLGVNSKLPVSQPNAPRVLPFEEGSDKCLRSLGQCLVARTCTECNSFNAWDMIYIYICIYTTVLYLLYS